MSGVDTCMHIGWDALLDKLLVLAGGSFYVSFRAHTVKLGLIKGLVSLLKSAE